MEIVEPLGWHVMLRLRDNRVITPDRAARRAAVRALHRIAKAGKLLAFAVVDTHIHLLLLCERAVAGEIARRLEIAMSRQARLPVPFSPAFFKPVLEQSHLSSAFYYILGQLPKHGVGSDPVHEGTAIQDLLATRRLDDGIAGRVKAHLPRVTREKMLAKARLPAFGEVVDLSLLIDSASAAFALPDLTGRTQATVRARRAAVHAALSRTSAAKAAAKAAAKPVGEVAAAAPAAIPKAVALAAILGVSEQTVRSLHRAKCAPADIRAVRRQMALRHAVANAPAPDPDAPDDTEPDDDIDPRWLNDADPS